MIDWLQQNHQLISLVISTCTLLVWVFYAQLLLLNFWRQRRPSLIINRGAGKGLHSLCLISNMSAEPMFINQLFVCVRTTKGTLKIDVTDIRQNSEDDASPDLAIHQATHQGPLRTGEFTHIGTFQGMLRQAARQHRITLNDDRPADDWEFQSLEIRVVAFYGSERHPIGVMRCFRLVDYPGADCTLVPTSPLTRQLTSRWQRRRVRQWLSELAD